MKSPLNINDTVRRYNLDAKLKKKLIAFDEHIWQDFKIKSVADLTAFEKKYNELGKPFDFCFDNEINAFSSVSMRDGEMYLLQKGAFLRSSQSNGKVSSKCVEYGLSDLETVVLITFFAEISGLYRKDAYYYGVPPFITNVCDVLNSAIAKLPVYSESVVRACNMYDKADFKVGDVFLPMFCLTCSADLTWKDKGENRYKIKTLDAKHTKARSLYSVNDISEKQVTFLQNASFRITAVNDWGEEKKEFEMEEI
jgi:hypothetical protein